MTGRLRPTPGPQVIKVLEAHGWYLKRIRGSHHIMRHPTIPDSVPVPVHGNRPIPTGTLLNILRAARLSREEFLRAL